MIEYLKTFQSEDKLILVKNTAFLRERDDILECFENNFFIHNAENVL